MSRRSQRNVGVIGLGIIGTRIADHLRRRGFHVFVWNRTPRPFPNFVGSRSELAEVCDFIQIFVSDDDALLESVEQLKRSLKEHHVVLAHSTVAPSTMRAAAEIVQRRGAQLLDVPFTGSKLAAEKGELVYYVGGDHASLERARPVLAASSKEIIEMGEIGHATTLKLATNLITASTVQATAEALALVDRAGLSTEKFAAAMRGNASQSPTLAMKLPKMIAGDFEPHFSIKHMLKDMQIASRLARSHGLDLGTMEAARASLRREAEDGRGDLDYSAVVQAFFPDGIGAKEALADESVDEQQTLGGLDESSAAPEIVAPVEQSAEAVAATADADETKAAVEEPSASAVETLPPGATQISEEPASTESNITEGGDQTEVDEKSDLVAPEVVAEIEDRADQPKETEPEPLASAEVAEMPKDEPPSHTNGETEPRRGLFSRMFGKAGDY